jgi:hypothetical protein
MIRRIAFVSIPVVLALGAWLLLRNKDGDPAPVAPPPVEQPAAQSEVAPAVEVAKDAVPAPAEAAVVRTSAASESTQPTFPDDAKWLEVLVVDAATQQPIEDAEVRWTSFSVHKQIQALPEKERPALYRDQELTAHRFGWLTHSNASGIARIAGDTKGCTVFGYSEGRYGTTQCGGERPDPTGGWRLELEADKTLRVQVLDIAGKAAVSVAVKIRMFDANAKEKPNWGWVQPQKTAAPDGIAEFHHVQTWLRRNGAKKPEMAIASWRALVNLPGFDDAGVEFDQANPPSEPIVLHVPATGRLTARLLHAGQPLTRGVTFSAYRGEPSDNDVRITAVQCPPDDDGWAHFPHVALGGSLTVLADLGPATIDASVLAPTGMGQEVRTELTTDELYIFTGRLLGPDGKLLTNTTVSANFSLKDMMSGSGSQVETDEHGHFLWLLTKGQRDTSQIERLMLTQRIEGASPLTVKVAPREIRRGITDLGDLQFTAGPLVVAGKFEVDTPEALQGVQFTIQRMREPRGRDNTEQWDDLRNVTTAQNPDSTFEVRGETQPGRHRLLFPAYNHLPISPIEFAVGTRDIIVPVTLGNPLLATCILPEALPADQLRGVLRPNGEVPAEPQRERYFRNNDRYTATAQGTQDPPKLQWRALPAGTYTLEMRTSGISSPLMTIPDVVVPPAKEGDPRLQNIDLRGKVNTLKVHVSLTPTAKKRNELPIVFPMPQADETHWQGLLVRDGALVMPTPPGPTNLLIACEGYKPQRILGAERDVKVTLEPWPSVELIFANLPELPKGVALGVSIRNPESTKQYRDVRFSTDYQSRGIDGLLNLSYSSSDVKDGRATVQIGDGTYSISAYLQSQDRERAQSLKSLNPKEILGGSNLAPITVQWSEDELRAALEELQKASKRK